MPGIVEGAANPTIFKLASPAPARLLRRLVANRLRCYDEVPRKYNHAKHDCVAAVVLPAADRSHSVVSEEKIKIKQKC
jgi:hypothetical protein